MAEVPAGTPSAVAPYVQVLGVDLTVEVLLALGGSEVYLSPSSNGSSRLARIVGREKAAELAATLGSDRQRRIPTAKAWLAERLAEQGLPKAEIARRLHVTDVSVRGWLDRAARRAAGDPRQPRLI
ncbi:helix-turn-helix domain-containing protein [Albimonas sp. CAU 1670]|uniref:helix-turn-helix domain-containing protein n=1 Tax=Albimonas sp. CAU 1670 TaxID=3032599 RepID=UPI0023DAFB50|nr:helix-turn-helix domain-containing protein [Albimonas sp. CAU 1670]MDF2232192.1 helix-turn-helix domain-containing protein [Albimonas sp. CAU 1670]